MTIRTPLVAHCRWPCASAASMTAFASLLVGTRREKLIPTTCAQLADKAATRRRSYPGGQSVEGNVCRCREKGQVEPGNDHTDRGRDN